MKQGISLFIVILKRNVLLEEINISKKELGHICNMLRYLLIPLILLFATCSPEAQEKCK